MVDIDFRKRKMALDGVLIGQTRKDGGNGSAGRTPVCVKIDNYVGGGRKEGIELSGLENFVNIA